MFQFKDQQNDKFVKLSLKALPKLDIVIAKISIKFQ